MQRAEIARQHDANLVGENLLAVVIDDAAAIAIAVKSDAKVWIDSASGRIVKSESEGEAMGIKSKTVQTIEYDPSIKIEAPVK